MARSCSVLPDSGERQRLPIQWESEHGNDRLRRPGHHGGADGGAPARCRLHRARQRPSRPAAQIAARQGAEDRLRPRRGGARGDDRHHHGPRHAAGCRCAVFRARHRRGPVAGQAGHRHELDLADRNQTLRRKDQCARLRLSRCAGVGRRGRRQGGVADDHGRRQRSRVRPRQAGVREDGQEHHAGRRRTASARPPRSPTRSWWR